MGNMMNYPTVSDAGGGDEVPIVVIAGGDRGAELELPSIRWGTLLVVIPHDPHALRVVGAGSVHFRPRVVFIPSFAADRRHGGCANSVRHLRAVRTVVCARESPCEGQ
jgi:hypothetical protein